VTDIIDKAKIKTRRYRRQSRKTLNTIMQDIILIFKLKLYIRSNYRYT